VCEIVASEGFSKIDQGIELFLALACRYVTEKFDFSTSQHYKSDVEREIEEQGGRDAKTREKIEKVLNALSSGTRNDLSRRMKYGLSAVYRDSLAATKKDPVPSDFYSEALCLQKLVRGFSKILFKIYDKEENDLNIDENTEAFVESYFEDLFREAE
jgi:hypothetical protein